jgi:hypothetical protein
LEIQITTDGPVVDKLAPEHAQSAIKPRRSVKDVAKPSVNAIPAGFRARGGKFVVRLFASLRKNILQISRHHRRSINSESILLPGRYLEENAFSVGLNAVRGVAY